jgi:hypothetical protein
MSDHFIAISRGVDGFRQNDFTTGTASASSATFEFRIKDGSGATKKDAHNALEALIRFLETSPWVVASGADLKL